MNKKFKPRYQYAGRLTQVEKANDAAVLGGFVQGLGGVANMIPGLGPIAGLGLNFAGGMIQQMSAPNMTALEYQKMNTSPMGFQFGGSTQTGAMQGGTQQPLSNGAVQVNAHSPHMTDSIDAGDVMLDDQEVVVGDKVFSNTLKNPWNNISFAQQEKQTQKALGKFEKYQTTTGDNEMKDKKYHDRNSEELFNTQENVASLLGLRNPDGTPTQSMDAMSPKEGFIWGGLKTKMNMGGKMRYAGGGNLPPEALANVTGDIYNPTSSFPNIYYRNEGQNWSMYDTKNTQKGWTKVASNHSAIPQLNSWKGNQDKMYQSGNPQTGAEDFGVSDNNPLPMPFGLQSPEAGTFSNTSLSDGQSLNPINPEVTNMPFKKAIGMNPETVVDMNPGDRYEGAEMMDGKLMPIMGRWGMNDINGVKPISFNSMVGNTNTPNITNMVTQGMNSPFTQPQVPTVTPGTQDPTSESATNLEAMLKEFKGYNPYGEQATRIGQGMSACGMMMNTPRYVNYADVGQGELNQQGLAMARMRSGEATAVQDAILQGQLATNQVGGRSLQTRNANLRNIALGTSKAIENVRGNFAGREAQMRTQMGQRQTAIQQANLQKNMYQDDINTKEYDTMLTENMKLLQNQRNMQIEQQLAFNKFRQDKTLEKVLKTKNFEWGDEGIQLIQEEMKKRKEATQTAAPKQQPFQAYNFNDYFKLRR